VDDRALRVVDRSVLGRTATAATTPPPTPTARAEGLLVVVALTASVRPSGPVVGRLGPLGTFAVVGGPFAAGIALSGGTATTPTTASSSSTSEPSTSGASSSEAAAWPTTSSSSPIGGASASTGAWKINGTGATGSSNRTPAASSGSEALKSGEAALRVRRRVGGADSAAAGSGSGADSAAADIVGATEAVGELSSVSGCTSG